MSSFKRNLAIVIGINRYSHGIPSLHTAVPDATAIAQVLEDSHAYEVTLYRDEDATLEKLTGLLQQIELNSSDRLLFYFAGHGIALNGDDGPQGYLIPQDAKLGDVATYLPMAQVEATLTQLQCRHCLIILDCCFGGAFRWSSTRKLLAIPEVIHKERYDRFIQDPAWQVITSASHDQYALDALDLKDDRGTDKLSQHHSPFAAALMDALQGKADAYPPGRKGQPAGDGVIAATELYLYLRDRVEAATDARNIRQTPGLWCLKNHDKGEYIFLTPDHGLNLPSAPTLGDLQEKNNPYRGLKAYEREHRALFFGRTSLIESLCDFVCDRPFTVVLGASGSGKSSLVKAGLIPHLEGFEAQQQQRERRLKREEHPHQHHHQKWLILPIVRPGEAPLDGLKKAFQESNLLPAPEVTALESEAFIQVLKHWYEQNPNTKLLLVVDQAEELITQCLDEQEREQFLQLLNILLQRCSGHFHVLLTLRSDFEPQFSEHELLKSRWVVARFIVPAMTRDELRDVIEEPASSKVVYFETSEERGSLVEQLINEVASMPGALPLLSFALSELYLKLARRFLDASNATEIADRLITWQDYDELGGVTRSLTEKADAEYNGLTQENPAYAQTIRSVMLRMVSIDGGSATKRKVPRQELEYPGTENDRVNQVLTRFEQARLIVSNQEEEGTPYVYVEPAHDALILGWKTLRDWLQAEGENLTIQRQLTHAAEYWRHNQQRSRFLWHNNPRLSLFEDRRQTRPLLNQLERSFVQHSVSKRRLNTLRNGGIFAGILFLGFVGTVFWRSSEINQMRDLQGSAEARLLQGQPLEALIESIKAGKALRHPLLRLFRPGDSIQNEVRETLQNAVSQIRERNRLMTDEQIHYVAFSPDGQMIATVHRNDEHDTVRFWDISGQPLPGLNSPSVDTIYGISFTPDSKQLVAKVDGGNPSQAPAKRWNIGGSDQIKESLSAESLGFNSFEDTLLDDNGNYGATSPDGTVRAIAEDGMLFIYSIAANNGENQPFAIADIPIHFNSYLPLYIRFSPDSQRIATAGYGHDYIYLWDLGGNQLAHFQHTGGIQDLKFSPDGQQLASVGRDGVVRLWQNLEDSQRQEFRGYSGQDPTETIQISSNQQRVATSTESGTVQVWDLASREKAELTFPGEKIVGLHFSPDDRFLTIGSETGTAWIWNLESGLLTPPMAGPDLSGQGSLYVAHLRRRQWGASFSPDNEWLVLGGADTTLHNILQPDNQIVLPREEGEEGDITIGWLQGFAFSKTGEILAAGGFSGRLRLWDWRQTTLLQEIETRVPIHHLAFSPNDDLVAVTGMDNGIAVVKLWTVAGEQQAELRGHTQMINSVVFNAQGNQLATASNDGTVRVWNIHGQQLAVFEGHDLAKDVAFSSDGRYLISAGFSSNIAAPDIQNASFLNELWQVKTWELQTVDELLVEGCTWIQGYLNHSQDIENRPEFQGDRTLCDDILSNAAMQISSPQITNLTSVTPVWAETASAEPFAPTAVPPEPISEVSEPEPVLPKFQMVNPDPQCSSLGYPTRFAWAETQNFQVYICGTDAPQIYFGIDKRNQNTITLSLNSADSNVFTAFNGSYIYTLTEEELSVTVNNEQSLTEPVQSAQ